MQAASYLRGCTLVKGPEHRHVSVASLRGKVLGLYFSAHWCGPCRQFTPRLADFYRRMTAEKPGELEIVFVSTDRSPDEFSSYFAEMPWLAMAWEHRAEAQSLAVKLGLLSIPTLVLIDPATGEVLTKNGRQAVVDDPSGLEFPWRGYTGGACSNCCVQ